MVSLFSSFVGFCFLLLSSQTIRVYSNTLNEYTITTSRHSTTTSTAREFSLAWISKSFSPEKEERNLQRTGDVWRACSGNKTEGKQTVTQNNTEYTKSIYDYTDYDDEHKPACTCFFDKEESEYWAQCALGDKTCNSETAACTGTHEFFLFSDFSGDLKQKSSCSLCTDVNNCASVEEMCTLVVFNENATPDRCILKQVHGDGTQTRCDECNICMDTSGAYGISHNCFGNPTPKGSCNTEGTAHLHNFVPVIEYEQKNVLIGGTFGKICNRDEVEALYSKTNYDDGYKKTCECKDPTQGLIVCDLFLETDTSTCFANECTEVSDLFFFDSSGDLNEKMTCDLSNDTCTTVRFSASGEPIGCTVFSPTNLDTCDDCTICKDETLQLHGVRYDCFGHSVGKGLCFIDKGIAVFNLPQEHAQDNIALIEAGETISSDQSNVIDNNRKQLVLLWVFGAIFSLCFVTVIITLCMRVKRKARGEATVSEEVQTAIVVDTVVHVASILDDPPEVIVDQYGQPMIDDPTPITIT